MPNQDGLKFLFDIQDKLTPKLIKMEAKAKSSAAKIDKAFTKASRSQEANSARAIKAEQRRIAAAEKAHAKSVALLKRQSDAFKRSMTRLASAATVAFAAVAGKAIQMAGGYDQAMRSVQAKTGATGADLDKLSAQAREMGRTTVHSATEAARGQAFLAQAGFDANEILSALPATLALATAGELDLASAADIASNVVSGFRLEIDKTGHVADVLAKSAASSNTSVAEMGAAMAKAAPAAASAGWSLEQTAAAIGVLANNAIKGEEGGTLLKTMLAKLAPTTGATAKKLEELGIEVHTITGGIKPLDEILQALAPHTDNTGLMFELLGTRGANAGLILGSLAEGELAQMTTALENSDGAAQEMADIMGGGLWGAIKKIQSIVESAYISFGERFGPVVEKLAGLFAKLPAPIQEVVVILGSLVGAMGGLMLIAPASFGALVQLPGKLIGLVKKIKLLTALQYLWNAALTANPIGLVVAAVALLAGGLLILYKRMKDRQQQEKEEAKAYKAELKRLKALKAAADKRRKSEEKEAKAAAKVAKALEKAQTAEIKRLKALEKAQEAAAKAAKELKKKQDALRESFEDTINPSEKLGGKIEFLIDEFDREDVVRKYSKEILDARDASVKYKTKLDPLIASMVDQAEVFVLMERVANNGVAALTKLVDINLVPLSTDVHNLGVQQRGLASALDGVNASVDAQNENLEN